MEISLNGSDWKFRGFWPVVGRRSGKDQDSSDWPSAEVPGCVQRDMLRIGKIDDPYVDFKSRDAEWVSNKEWVYVKKFDAPRKLKGKRIRIRFDGVDYFADYYLNGEHLGESGNLFVPIEFDVTDKLKFGEENTLAVVLHPAPPEQAQMGWTSKVWTMKPRFCYQWDFSTQLAPIGIWQDVKLLVNNDIRLTGFWTRSVLSKDLKRGEARMQVEIESASVGQATVEVEVSFAGKKAGSAKQEVKLNPGQTTAKLKISVPNVKLWWPNGSGEQNLYEAEVRLLDAAGEVIDERKTRFGFKHVRLTPNTNVSPEALPWSFEVNGRRTFIKGWNWVPIDHMYGGDLDAKYERLLKLARDANANLIRIWGGGLIEKEIFYRLCDECGIMVWQEFTLSSSAMESVPPTNPAYLKMLREAATKIVPLRRNHASLTVWCGGNELVWAGEEDPAMKIMHSICAKLDPDRLYIPTSPMLIAGERQSPDRDIHGNWLYNGVEAHYKAYNDLRATFHSEFGCEGAANLENIPRFIKDVALWPPSVKNEIWAHRGEWWANYEKLCGIFGEITDLPAFVRLSQFIQWEGLRYIIEANRRRKHSCGGAIPWQYNEPWPNLSCTNAVDWYATPKMAYYAVARAYDPVRVSAKYEKLAWKESETFRADIWVNNSLDAIPGASVETRITDVYGTLLCEMDATLDVQENRATHAFALDWRLPAGFEGIFMLTALLRDGNGIVRSENVYIFGASSGAPLSPMMSLPPTKIKVKKIEDGKGKSVVSIANKGTAYAMFVRLRPKDLDADIYFNDNYLVIPPGEERTVSVRLDGGGGKLICAGWNTNCLEVGG